MTVITTVRLYSQTEKKLSLTNFTLVERQLVNQEKQGIMDVDEHSRLWIRNPKILTQIIKF